MTALAFALVPLIYFRCQRKSSQKGRVGGDYYDNDLSLSSIAGRGRSLKPPFPPVVREVLRKSRLAYLSTVDADLASSHLSLMRFTYVNDPQDGEVIIMSTNRKTKKFEMLQNQQGVALLVHDFQHDGKDGVYSITLNGDCRIVDLAEKAEQYRAAHLNHNPEYPQFIVGEDIAILCVHVTSARICNIYDQVVKWDVAAEY
jgi:general stress protein 26